MEQTLELRLNTLNILHWSVYNVKSLSRVYSVEARIGSGRWLSFHQESSESFALAKIDGYFERFKGEYTLIRAEDVMSIKRTGRYKEKTTSH